MGSKPVGDMQAGFSGGLNAAGDPNFLAPDQARQLSNVKLSRIGAATKRNGTQLVASSAIGVGWGGTYWKSQKKVIVFGVSGDDLYYSGTTSYPLTWSAISSGASSMTDAVPFIGTNGAEWLYCPTNVDLYRWDGSAGSLVASTGTNPLVDSLVVYNDRLWGWIGQAASTTNALYYSPLATTVGTAGGDGLGDASLGGGVIMVRTFGAAAIKCCFPVGASLLIFHQRGVSRLSGFGQDDTAVEPQGVSESVSILSRRAACVYKDVAYFLTTNGLYRATESDFAPVATPERPDPTVALIQAAAVNTYTTCVFNDVTQEVYVSFTPGSSASLTTTTTYVYNTLLQAWTGPLTGTWDDLANATLGVVMFQAFDVTKVANGNFISQVWGQRSDGHVFQGDAAAYYKDGVAAAGTGGSAFTTTIQPHRMFGKDRLHAKSWRECNILATLTAGGTAPVVAASSQNLASTNHTLSNLTSATKPYYLTTGGNGPYLDLIITDTGTTASQYELVEVQGWLLGKR